ncbi:hypothetical protein Lal_00012902 [Lupinus albus]|nr:hypothetical protein Lal_00012902 [Lupinus albus]
MNHAFFKELLFLSACSVIHAMSDEQDMRKMGGLASSFPFTYAMMLMGSLSLIEFPFLTGFYSIDVILELAYTKYTISGNFAFCDCCSPDTIIRGRNSPNMIIRGEQELGIGCGRNSRQWLRCSVDSLPPLWGFGPLTSEQTREQKREEERGPGKPS